MDKKDRLIKNLSIDETELNKDNPILVEFLKKYKQNTPTKHKKDEVNSICPNEFLHI